MSTEAKIEVDHAASQDGANQHNGDQMHDPNAYAQAYYPSFPPQPQLPVTAAPFFPAGSEAYAAAYMQQQGVALQQTPSFASDASLLGPSVPGQPQLTVSGSGVSPYASPFLGPISNTASPFLGPYGYAPGPMYYGYGGGSMQPSPFLQPMGMNMGMNMGVSPTLSAVSSAPNSPGLTAQNTTWASVTSKKGAYELFVQNFSGSNLANNVYIRGLPPSMSDEALIALCAPFGTIVSSKSILDQQTNECKGFGFVMYASEDQANNAITQLTALGYQASFAKESFSTRLKNLQDPTSTNIYLSNLPMDMDEAKLEDLFRPYKVMSSRILRDNNGQSRGVGFARLIDRDSALAVIQKFNGYALPGSSVALQVRFADSMAQKKLKAQTQRKRVWRAQESKMSQQPFSAEDDYSTTPHMGPMYYPNQMMAGMYNPAMGQFGYTQMPGYSPYMQPQMMVPAAGMYNYAGYSPTAQPPSLQLPEANGEVEQQAQQSVHEE